MCEDTEFEKAEGEALARDLTEAGFPEPTDDDWARVDSILNRNKVQRAEKKAVQDEMRLPMFLRSAL